MISGRVSDGDVERVLTAARRTLLDAAARDEELAVPDFCSALARQCFINEYVFAQTDAERAEVSRLSAALDARLGTGGDFPMAWPMAVAAYMPLHALWRASQLMDRRWPDPVTQIVVQQIREPLEERAIRVSLPALTAIDADSVAVQAQYEENPYPRWIIPPPAVKALTVDDYLRAKFPLSPLRPLATPGGPEILIAGCGSGSHAIEAYRRFAAARVLAVDLSRSSLAYAARRTRELGLPIDYAQADILRLGDLERTFDVIEANGSLQCLKDPAAGWRVLLSLLKPDGVMMLGLYSRTARQDINAARAAIAARGCGAGADDIRRCRQEIFALPDGAPGKTVISAGDFYSTSDCRDLLFHVQEYQHTLPEIAAFLAAENLQFLGFQLDARVLRAYAAENPEDPAMIDLDRWHRFECKNPGIFASMYQFAIQKA
jgi:SAM-dependent methyltransferase